MTEQTLGTISPEKTLEVLNNIKQILEVTPVSGKANNLAVLQAMELVDGLIASQMRLANKSDEESTKEHLANLVKDNPTTSNAKVSNEK